MVVSQGCTVVFHPDISGLSLLHPPMLDSVMGYEGRLCTRQSVMLEEKSLADVLEDVQFSEKPTIVESLPSQLV